MAKSARVSTAFFQHSNTPTLLETLLDVEPGEFIPGQGIRL